MGVSRSSFYDTPSQAVDDTSLVEAMHAVKDEVKAYGWRRMPVMVARQGWAVNHKKINRLMRERDLQPRLRRRFMATMGSRRKLPIFLNLAKDMVPDGPHRLRVADMTYIAINPGFV